MARRVTPLEQTDRMEDARLRLRPSAELADEGPAGAEHRGFPRAKMRLKVAARVGPESDPRFSASFLSDNVSLSGAFLESTFYLPVGTELDVSFAIEGEREEISARAEVVRDERPSPSGAGRSGMGIRFLAFDEQSEVALARVFVGPRIRAFAEGYLKSKRVKKLSNEVERLIDALAAWELLRVRQPEDPWRPEGTEE